MTEPSTHAGRRQAAALAAQRDAHRRELAELCDEFDRHQEELARARRRLLADAAWWRRPFLRVRNWWRMRRPMPPKGHEL